MRISWDEEIDTPATIAVIGGGPVGVEAALYARFLGYSVVLLDSVKVGHRSLAWGERPMAAPWGEVTSSLGLAALEAQGSAVSLPTAAETSTYREYVEKYLLPVARTDLLHESVQINSKVVSISRSGCRLESSISVERRAEQEFRLLIDSRQRGEYSQLVDIVLDCSGMERPRGLATGGGLAVGELSLGNEIRLGKVNLLGRHREAYAGKHTLMFGDDYCACVNALDFAQLARAVEETKLTWILPKRLGSSGISFQPVERASKDVATAALALCEGDSPSVVALPAWGIESLKREATWSVRVQVGEEETLDIRCDGIINCAQQTIDWSFLGALKTPVAIGDGATSEPHYYVLGQKAEEDVGGTCTIAQGLQQIRRVFARIGGRPELDLYEVVKRQNA